MTITLSAKQFEHLAEQERVAELRRNPPLIMTAEEVAIVTNKHVDTIYQLVAEGSIPNKKDGRGLRFFRDSILSWYRKGENL